MGGDTSEFAIYSCINQHKFDVLDEQDDLNNVLKTTFGKEFMNVLQVCMFVPFLHSETPKPQDAPKTAPKEKGVVPQADTISQIVNVRREIELI